jgi:hypothetical protein
MITAQAVTKRRRRRRQLTHLARLPPGFLSADGCLVGGGNLRVDLVAMILGLVTSVPGYGTFVAEK